MMNKLHRIKDMLENKSLPNEYIRDHIMRFLQVQINTPGKYNDDIQECMLNSCWGLRQGARTYATQQVRLLIDTIDRDICNTLLIANRLSTGTSNDDIGTLSVLPSLPLSIINEHATSDVKKVPVPSKKVLMF